MRRTSILFLLVCTTGCSTSSLVWQSHPSAPVSPFVGRWMPSSAKSQPYFASTLGFQLALDANGTSVTRAVLVHKPTTQPATVVGEMYLHGTWTQKSPTTVELCFNSSDGRGTARLVSDDKIVIEGRTVTSVQKTPDGDTVTSVRKTPDIEFQRDR